MDINELINLYQKHNPDYHFFDKQTLKFFGERVSDMYVLKSEYEIKNNNTGEIQKCYGISRLQRNHPDGAKRTHAYFDKQTFKPVLITDYKTIKLIKKEVTQ